MLARTKEPLGASYRAAQTRVLVLMISGMSCVERIRGSHHIFIHSDLIEIVNIQALVAVRPSRTRVRQIRQLILRYGRRGEV
jgi:predicted RNA binding protein YcfA (HicA-like mRNA interferase family)